MRIAWVISGFSKDENDYGGAAAIHNLAKEISQQSDIELVIFSLYYPHNQREYNFYAAKVYSFSTGTADPSPYAKLKIWNSCIKTFNTEHSQKKFDIIHSFWAGEPGYVASKIARKHNIPLIANICGGELAEIKSIGYGSRLKLRQKKLVDKTFQRANRIISGSDYITNKISKYYTKEIAGKAVKIPFGVDEKKFFPEMPARSRGDNIRLINIANCVPVKAHSDLLKAVSIVKDKYPRIELLCYGRDDNSVLQTMVNEMKLNDFVKVKGFIEYSEIPHALYKADIFVLSSLYESQNMAMLEAAFCGLSVVSTEAGVASELTPYLAKEGDYKSLAAKIAAAIENPKPVYNVERFSLINSASRFIELYKSLIQ
jgi:glycosyltransferase involved in cell wall biosynthesis